MIPKSHVAFDNAMEVTLDVTNFTMKRLFVDNGSLASIIFFSYTLQDGHKRIITSKGYYCPSWV